MGVDGVGGMDGWMAPPATPHSGVEGLGWCIHPLHPHNRSISMIRLSFRLDGVDGMSGMEGWMCDEWMEWCSGVEGPEWPIHPSHPPHHSITMIDE